MADLNEDEPSETAAGVSASAIEAPASQPTNKPDQKPSQSLDRGMQRFGELALSHFTVPVIIASTAGAGLWGLAHRSRLATVMTNKLKTEERRSAVIYLAVAAAVFIGIYGARVAWARVKRGNWSSTLATVRSTSITLSPLLGFPLLVALATPGIESANPALTGFFALLAGACWVPAVYHAAKAKAPDSTSKPIEWVSRVAVLGLGITYAWFFTRLSITNHHSFVTRTIDLGYYDNIFYQSIHGRPLGCSFIKAGYHGSAHFDPILVLLSPLYLLYPRAEMILTLQACWVAVGVVPAYLLFRHHLKGPHFGVAGALIYMLYPALHGANMYEFHSLTLLGMPMLWVLYFLESGRVKTYLVALLIALLIREDVALIMCFVGAYAILTKRPGYGKLGLATVVISLMYFGVAKAVFMTSSGVLMGGNKDAYSFAYYYRDLIPAGESFRGLLVSLVTNPAFVLKHVLSEKKLIYMLTMFGPFLFLPLLAKRGRFMMVYGAIFVLLASRPPVFSTHFQYSMVIFPIMVSLMPMALRQAKEGKAAVLFGWNPNKLVAGLVAGAVVASLAFSWKFGGFVKNNSFRGGFYRVTRSLTDLHRKNHAWLRSAIDRIEPGASVTVTNRVGPHLSNRKDVYLYGQAKETHYVLIDTKELGKQRAWHDRRVQRGELEEMTSTGTFKLFRFLPSNKPGKSAARPPPKRKSPRTTPSAVRARPRPSTAPAK